MGSPIGSARTGGASTQTIATKSGRFDSRTDQPADRSTALDHSTTTAFE